MDAPITIQTYRLAGTEKRERFYRIESDTFSDHCETVLVLAVRSDPWPDVVLAMALLPTFQTADGRWVAVLRVATDELEAYEAVQNQQEAETKTTL